MKKNNKYLAFMLVLCFCLSFCFTSLADETPAVDVETETQNVDIQLGFIESMLSVVFGNSVWNDESGSGTGSVFDPWEM